MLISSQGLYYQYGAPEVGSSINVAARLRENVSPQKVHSMGLAGTSGLNKAESKMLCTYSVKDHLTPTCINTDTLEHWHRARHEERRQKHQANTTWQHRYNVFSPNTTPATNGLLLARLVPKSNSVDGTLITSKEHEQQRAVIGFQSSLVLILRAAPPDLYPEYSR